MGGTYQRWAGLTKGGRDLPKVGGTYQRWAGLTKGGQDLPTHLICLLVKKLIDLKEK